MSSIAASTRWRNSVSGIGCSPRASRWAFMTIRRYLVTVTPGIATGYWKAMNRPARARSSGSASVMSSPSNRICPSVISRFGWPMIALASVDLPEPLGPMSAWNSVARTCRSTPLRICLSPAETCRLRISRSAMDLRCLRGSGRRRGDGSRGFDVRTLREGDQLGERGALQRLDDAHLHSRPQQFGGAVVPVGLVRAEHAAVAVVEEAVHRRDGALEGEHDRVHRDLLGRLGEDVAAVRAARGLDEALALQQRGDPLEVGEREVLRRGDRLQRDRTVAPVHAEPDQQAHAVLGLRREDHLGAKAYQRGRSSLPRAEGIASRPCTVSSTRGGSGI